MTELPEDVARELEELYGSPEVPEGAVTIAMLIEAKGGSDSMWGRRVRELVASGKWTRGRRTGDQSYWYWPRGEERD